jgi:hypothetical protein
MFFDVDFGFEDAGQFVGLFTAKGYALKKRRDGTSYWVQPPSKLRVKDGAPVKDEKGFDVYDKIIDGYQEVGAGKEGKRGLTKPAWGAQDDLLEQAQTAYQELTGATSGTVKSRGQRVGVAASTGAADRARPGAYEDDEPPF